MNRGKLVGVLDVASTTTKTMANMMVGREVSFKIEKNPANFGPEVLNVAGLTVKNQDGLQVVKNVSFSVRRGEIFAIAGVSGNGQIEVADAITGLIPASGGTISLNGNDITNSGVRERTVAGISYIPEDRQEVGLVLDFSLAENLAMKKYFREPFCEKGILNNEAFEEHGKRLIEEYDIRSGQGISTTVRSMSGGNQQKAIVAREIELSSELMIFVQPTRGLDIGAIENIHRQILAQRDAGRAILLISLELDEIIGLADTIGVMYNGEMLNIAPAETLTANQVGEYMMGVKAE